MGAKLTPDEFIIRSKKIHNNKYSYDKTVYTTSHNSVIVGCPIHGDFEQKAYRHLAGSGCNACGNSTTKSKLSMSSDEFIKRCKERHNNFYDYSLVDFKDLKSRIDIICPKHGQYSLVAVNHMNGSRCKQCRLEMESLSDKQKKYYEWLKSGELRRICNKEWLERIENNKGDLIIEKMPVKLQGTSIIHYRCNKHDYSNSCSAKAFTRNKFNCRICSNEFVSDKFAISVHEFIEKAKAIHGDYYDYSRVNYVNCTTKVEIICQFHGSFHQIPGNHINGKQGCPRCFREFRQPDIFYKVSSQEIKLQEWLSSKNITFEASNRNKIYPLELDLFLPDYNLAIEVNGVYWHSIGFKDEHYHINKLDVCSQNNITLLQFYDTEIDNDWDFVIGLLNSYLDSSVILPDDEVINRRFYPSCDLEIVAPTLENINGFDIWNSGFYRNRTKIKAP